MNCSLQHFSKLKYFICLYEDSGNQFGAILFYMSQKCHNELFMMPASRSSSFSLELFRLDGTYQGPSQPSAPSRESAVGSDQVVRGFIQSRL